MGPTTITVSVSGGTASVSWAAVAGQRGDLVRRSAWRMFGSQEEAEHFAAGVQAGIVSMGGSATVEIVTVSDPV
jgi:hypothetical protein